MGRHLSITNFLLGPILHPGVGIRVGGVSREQGAYSLAYSRPYPRGIGWRMEIHIPFRIFGGNYFVVVGFQASYASRVESVVVGVFSMWLSHYQAKAHLAI